MKTTLTIEESARLIELGVDPKLASKEVATTIYEQEYNDPRHPIFTLTDILAILPKEVRYNGVLESLTIFIDNNTSVATYPFYNSNDAHFISSELIDALYQLLIWAVENGYVKTDKQ